jgi:alpha,alpha-trehalase
MVVRTIVCSLLLLPALVWGQAAPARVPIEKYISETWDALTRSHRDLAGAAVDPKFPVPADGRWPVYVPATANLEEIQKQLRQEMAPGTFSQIDLRRLPRGRARMPGSAQAEGSVVRDIKKSGLLYLPHPYVVPGGRFNEM